MEDPKWRTLLQKIGDLHTKLLLVISQDSKVYPRILEDLIWNHI